ncbi:MAG: L-seryl-tRNA(Sec) selenium transferase [Acidimicrobiia bacterium]|nr:L-seryl-tRNA(Sec) selenium transferase [Acidimicrobiia bacterium]
MERHRPPSVDRLRRALPAAIPAALATDLARIAADMSRTDPAIDAQTEALRLAQALVAVRQRPVINATGVILHTNLGRAPLDPGAAQAASAAATGYTNLELDLANGERGGRTSYLTALLRSLTGADDALVVNNNAGALFLVLIAMAAGRQVPVSRGELIEIGGSYRLPDLIGSTGARMVEVGTTNRTRIADYAEAITGETALVLKVHPSNYRIEGFAAEVGVDELAELAHSHGLPMVFDAGSGLLDQRTPWLNGPPPRWLDGEPGVVQALEGRADLVLFSGDKLLGGPQAGIVVGDADLIAGLRRHPVARAMRVDGPTLAALETTLESYADRTAGSLPLWHMATIPTDELQRRCEQVAAEVPRATVTEGASTIGAGSVPGARIPSPVIQVPGAAEPAYGRLLAADRPIVTRREAGNLVVDLRTVAPDNDTTLAAALSDACRS